MYQILLHLCEQTTSILTAFVLPPEFLLQNRLRPVDGRREKKSACTLLQMRF